MCLVITKKRKEPYLAAKDIVVYKVLIGQKCREHRAIIRNISFDSDETYDPDEIYFTSYYQSPVKMDITYRSLLQRVPTDNYHDDIGKHTATGVVEVGIHSLRLKKVALNFAIGFGEYVAKCIIPAGSYYYVGWFEDKNILSYASDSIKYIEIVHEPTKMTF